MRLFIAINLSPEMKAALTDAQRTMYNRGVRGSFTPAENLHLTLAFIGEYPDADAVMDALSGVVFTPFALRLDGVGRFGDLWWAGLQDSAALTAVVRRVRRALAESGIPFDRKRFAPHITLLRKASRDAAGITVAPASMTVRTISLLSSRRGRNGMIYTEIGTLEADSVL
ncbi:MAG: RNA 2',3'-cyclic phosphodiesterase [Oscillospiraceae bacterium]|nr:RNA 2',3'-cyclic phosphodiesterase [Oscillospiraceae bacterium]MBQ6402909.1 RNA 2',3'-cyclic phosphodiesterase [Oscillospiraceae bacterium]